MLNALKMATSALLVTAFLLPAADKKHKDKKAPDVEMIEVSVKRSEALVSIDCRVRNIEEKPILGLTLVFEFFGPEHVPITTQKARIDEDSLPPGGEAAVHAQLNDPVRAVALEISAVDEHGRDFRVAKSGPYPIE